MFNYQGSIYHHVVDGWNRIKFNVSSAGLTRPFDAAADRLNMAASSAYYTLPLSLRNQLDVLYIEWKMFYEDFYKWIHPKFTELR